MRVACGSVFKVFHSSKCCLNKGFGPWARVSCQSSLLSCQQFQGPTAATLAADVCVCACVTSTCVFMCMHAQNSNTYTLNTLKCVCVRANMNAISVILIMHQCVSNSDSELVIVWV